MRRTGDAVESICKSLRFVGNNHNYHIIIGSHLENLCGNVSGRARSIQPDEFIHIQFHITGRVTEYDEPDGFYLLLPVCIPIVHQTDAKLRPGKQG